MHGESSSGGKSSDIKKVGSSEVDTTRAKQVEHCEEDKTGGMDLNVLSGDTEKEKPRELLSGTGTLDSGIELLSGTGMLDSGIGELLSGTGSELLSCSGIISRGLMESKGEENRGEKRKRIESNDEDGKKARSHDDGLEDISDDDSGKVFITPLVVLPGDVLHTSFKDVDLSEVDLSYLSKGGDSGSATDVEIRSQGVEKELEGSEKGDTEEVQDPNDFKKLYQELIGRIKIEDQRYAWLLELSEKMQACAKQEQGEEVLKVSMYSDSVRKHFAPLSAFLSHMESSSSQGESNLKNNFIINAYAVYGQFHTAIDYELSNIRTQLLSEFESEIASDYAKGIAEIDYYRRLIPWREESDEIRSMYNEARREIESARYERTKIVVELSNQLSSMRYWEIQYILDNLKSENKEWNLMGLEYVSGSGYGESFLSEAESRLKQEEREDIDVSKVENYIASLRKLCILGIGEDKKLKQFAEATTGREIRVWDTEGCRKAQGSDELSDYVSEFDSRLSTRRELMCADQSVFKFLKSNDEVVTQILECAEVLSESEENYGAEVIKDLLGYLKDLQACVMGVSDPSTRQESEISNEANSEDEECAISSGEESVLSEAGTPQESCDNVDSTLEEVRVGGLGTIEKTSSLDI